MPQRKQKSPKTSVGGSVSFPRDKRLGPFIEEFQRQEDIRESMRKMRPPTRSG